MCHWAKESIFYHIYPLGFCGAPSKNDFKSPATPRLEKLIDWIEHLDKLGMNALCLGPVFESTSHGYDTVDYFHIDRRLGDQQLLKQLISKFHQNGIRVVLDGVFNHVGRNFWAFRDLCEHLKESSYRNWFHGLSFEKSSPYGEPFSYNTWHDDYSLVKLNLQNQATKQHIFEAINMWIHKFDIDGLRLDAADCMDLAFLHDLRVYCKNLRPDFWLFGEVIHGDYRLWANQELLDSATNYEL